MPDIFKNVVAAVAKDLGGKQQTVDFVNNPNATPTSADRHSGSKPDGYLVLKDGNKWKSKPSKGEPEKFLWANIALSCEYKPKDGNGPQDDVRIYQGLGYRVLG